MMRWIFAALAVLALMAPSFASDSRSLPAGGVERSYLVYRPASLSRAAKVPLVIMLHGGFGSGSQAEKSYGWDGAADRGGFVVAYPDGYHRSWNAGGVCCGAAAHEAVDDVGFLDALITKLVVDEKIDPRRIFMTGMSNGAAMTYAYACHGKVALAAIGPVAGSFSAPCPRALSIPVMAVHGLEDKSVPFAGGHSEHRAASDVDWLGVERSLAVFRGGCTAPQTKTEGVVATSVASCGSGREVVLVTVAGAGHQWPGSERPLGARLLGLDPISEAFATTAQLAAFFTRHQAP